MGESAGSLVKGKRALMLKTMNLHEHPTSTTSKLIPRIAKRLVPRSGSLAEEEPGEEIEKISLV